MESTKPQNPQADRTRREQEHVENLIKSFFERYYMRCLHEEKFEDDHQNEEEEEQDPETAISQFILRPFHAQYLTRNLRSTGTFLCSTIFIIN